MKHTTKITGFLALGVFTLFSMCILAVLLTGARVYRTQTERAEESYQARTAAQYLSTRVRQAEKITLEDFGGCQALAFPEQVGERTYLTRVYCWDGWLRELYCAEDVALAPEDGEKVLELENLSFSAEGNLLTVSLDDTTLTFSLEGKEDAR